MPTKLTLDDLERIRDRANILIRKDFWECPGYDAPQVTFGMTRRVVDAYFQLYVKEEE